MKVAGEKEQLNMCMENEPRIRVYTFDNNGMGGPTEDTVEGILENARSELEGWSHPEFGSSESITLTIKTSFMKQSEYDALPEFEGY